MEPVSEPKPRIMGIENEFSVPDTGCQTSTNRYWLTYLSEMYREPFEGLVSAHTKSDYTSNSFHVNGFRWYMDVGDNVEIATPECAGFDQLVDYMVAGDHFVARAISTHLRKANEESNETEARNVRVHKRVLSSTGVSSLGFHENYNMYRPMIDRPYDPEIDASRLNPLDVGHMMVGFLIGRTILNGAGSIGVNSSGETVVMPAQKAQIITTAVGGGTTTTKPWIVNRPENHNGENLDYMRLQIVGGDANISPAAMRLTLGSTAIVLRMLENGVNPGLTVNNVSSASAMAAKDWDGKAYVNVDIDGIHRGRRPIELLDHYLDLAMKHSGSGMFSADEEAFLPEWARVSDAYRRDPLELADTLDWAAKRQFLEDRGMGSLAKAKLLESLYDLIAGQDEIDLGNSRTLRIDENSRVGWNKREHGEFSYNIDPDTVEHSLFNPPQNTRARHRGEIITAMKKLPETETTKSCDWSSALYKDYSHRLTKEIEINMYDPEGNLSEKDQLAKQSLLDLADQAA